MPRYYSAHNFYANETNIGFHNTWYVLVWKDRKSRDTELESREDLASRAIKRSEIGNYIERPKPFSGQRWVVYKDGLYSFYPGCLGVIIIGNTIWGKPLNP